MLLETYTRVFVKTEQIEHTISSYQQLLNGQVSTRFEYPEAELELTAVSGDRLSVLIFAGTLAKRAAFEETRLTVRVDRLEAHLNHLVAAGATQLEPVQTTPVGRKTRFRHPDGLVVEYVDHTSTPDEVEKGVEVCTV